MRDTIERAFDYYRKEGLIPTIKLTSFHTSNLIYHKRLGHYNFNPNGIDIHKQDWDNMIILDACRYDAFKQINIFQNVDSVYSRGSSTSEFIKANFKNKDLSDTVYITGNGWLLRLKDNLGTKIHRVYDLGDNSDRSKMERTTKCAKACIERHPNKRLLIHYIPPHHPYTGELAEKHLPGYENQIERPLFNRIRRGEIEIDDSTLYEIYLENLRRVIPEVEKLLNVLPGKTVVTADHGELLGERVFPVPIKYYGHIPGLYVDELVKVPWMTNINGERKIIESGECRDEPDTEFGPTDKSVEERLKDLGYRM